MVHCVILDTGVRHNHKAFRDEKLSGFTLTGNDELEVQSDFEDSYGHGTAVYGIIREPETNITNIRLAGCKTSFTSSLMMPVTLEHQEEGDKS